MNKKINNLQDIGNRMPFTVPEDYFARFNKDIMNQLPEKPKSVAKKVTMWDKAKPWIYMAAMFIGLFFSIRILTTNMHDKKTNAQAQLPAIQNTNTNNYWSNVSISEDEFYQYLEEQIDTQENYQFLFEEMYQQSL